MSQLQSDLKVVFGFSAENARKAEELLHANRLPEEFKYLVKNVLENPYTRINPTKPRSGRFVKMNELNYKLSVGEI